MVEHTAEGCSCEGKPCKACENVKCLNAFGPAKRGLLGRKARCRECLNKASNEWYHSNIEAGRAKNLASYHKHKDKHKASGKRSKEARYEGRRKYYENNRDTLLDKHYEWRLANPEKHKQLNRSHYERNREAYIKRASSYLRNNRELANKYRRTYRRKHPDETIAQKHRRRVHVTNGGRHFTAQEWHALKAQHGFACLRCGRKEPDIRLTADHVIPVTRGSAT